MSARLPSVVIVGRPNVGKSTLFNRIVGRRVAVIEDFPGVTRDRLYADAVWNGRPFTLVDTGGILFSDDDPLIEQIRLQSEIALSEADVVLFMVDCGEGVNPGDMELANSLRGIKKPVLVIANKADNPKRESMATEFCELAIGEVFPISGLNGRNVADILDLVVKEFPAPSELEEQSEEIKLAIVGRPNVGKSSMLNAFAGETRVIVSDIPGTTRDAIDTVIHYKKETFRLIDTAGIRRRGKVQGTVEYYMVLRAERAIERADCALLLMDGKEGVTDGDKRIGKTAHDLGKACVIGVNKWDVHEPPDGRPKKMSPIKKDLIRIFRDEMPELNYAPIVFTSAKEGSGLEPLLDKVLQAVESWNFRIPTGQLNRVIQDALFERPFTRKGKNFKVYYCTQPSIQPPTFVLFCNDPDLLHFSYKRYLENRIRKEFPMAGTPIRVIARSSHKKED